jgi:two-component sensor histidine kinase
MALQKNVSFKTRIVILFLAISLLTLMLSSSILIYHDLKAFKESMKRNLSVLAATIAANSRAAMIFEDPNQGERILAALKAEPQVYYAILKDIKGNDFVHYKKEDIDLSIYPIEGEIEDKSSFFSKYLKFVHPVKMDDQAIGEIHLFVELTEMNRLIVTYTQLIGFVIVATLPVAFLISLQLQKLISKPILNLAFETKKISESTQNYIPLTYGGKDEIGVLYEGFNQMMSRINARENELIHYRNTLEAMVKTRTLELANSNEELQSEVIEKKRVEQDLRKSLEEKEVLLKEIHHRVKNNLQIISSLLKLETYHSKEEHSVKVLADCSNRIESMALLHEKIYEAKNLKEIDFEQYILDLSNYLLASFGKTNNKIKISLVFSDTYMDIDLALPLGLIIQELITNSLKYGFPNDQIGQIHVTFNNTEYPSSGNFFELQYSDTGVGLNEDFDLNSSSTLGLKLVRRLVEKQLGGTIELGQKNKAEFKIRFPKGNNHDS